MLKVTSALSLLSAVSAATPSWQLDAPLQTSYVIDLSGACQKQQSSEAELLQFNQSIEAIWIRNHTEELFSKSVPLTPTSELFFIHRKDGVQVEKFNCQGHLRRYVFKSIKYLSTIVAYIWKLPKPKYLPELKFEQ